MDYSKLEMDKKLKEGQFGFRKGRGMDMVYIVNYVVKKIEQERRKNVCLFCKPKSCI